VQLYLQLKTIVLKVYINSKELQIFEGARLQDAVLLYSKDEYQRLLREEIELLDCRGNGMDIDGQLWDGASLLIKTIV
jgi:hypothetical protein